MRTAPLLLSLSLLLPLAAAAQSSPPTAEVPDVVVSGSGEARATPDRVLVTVGVQSRAATAAAAAAQNARRQKAVLDTLRSLGIGSAQLSTSSYSVYPEMQQRNDGQEPRVVGYVVSNTVRVDLRQIEQAGQVIDASLAAGANQVHGLNFYMADPGPVRRAAIAEAVSSARADAEALARAAGGRLGEILQLTTGISAGGPILYRQSAEMRVAGGSATPIEAGEEVVRASVTVRWRFISGS